MRSLTALLATLLTVACSKAPVARADAAPAPGAATQQEAAAFDLEKARQVIESKNAQFTMAHVTGDRATIDGMFTDDARVLPPNADPVIGRG